MKHDAGKPRCCGLKALWPIPPLELEMWPKDSSQRQDSQGLLAMQPGDFGEEEGNEQRVLKQATERR